MTRSCLSRELNISRLLFALLAALISLYGGSAHAAQNRNVTVNVLTGQTVVFTPNSGSATTVSTTSTISLNTAKTYTITINAPANYGILSASITDGTRIVSATYTHTDRTVNNYHDVGVISNYTPTDVSTAITFSSVLKRRYRLTSSVSTAAGTGTVSPVGDTYWLESENPAVTASATTHYGVQSAVINGSPQSVAGYPDSFVINVANIVSDTTVTAGFAYVWTISASVVGQTGTVSPFPTARVAAGGSKAFTVTAAAGSKILDVVINGTTSQGRQNSPYTYTFTNVSADQTIQATFYTPAVNITNYCDTPAFLSANLKPNLLLMLDNSASMYDLANTNVNASTYCYDNSYVNTSSYIGYFLHEQGEAYSYNFTSQQFDPASTSRPGSCTYSTSYFCISTQGGTANGAVTSFWAKGNFLNWLSASKLDQLKGILTGGKYDATSHVLIPESRGCVGRRFVKDVPTADWVARPSGGNLTFGVRGPNSYDVDYVTKSTQGGKTRIEIFPGTYDAVHCNAAVQDWTDPNSMGAIQSGGSGSNTSLCLGSTGSLKSNAYNHVIHLCYRTLTGNSNGSAELQPLEADCTSIYSTYYQNNPANITNETAGDAICASTLNHPLNNGNEIGFLGRCWTGGTWDPTLNSSTGGWVGGIAPTWNDSCAATEVQDYCQGAHAFDVTDPSDAAQIPNTSLITPSFIMDAGLAALGAPIATMLASVSRDVSPTGLINDFADVIGFGTIQHNYNGVGSAAGAGGTTPECGGTTSIPCAKACFVTATAAFASPTKECYVDTDCPSGQTCQDIPKMDGGIVSSYIGMPLGTHGTANTVIGNIDSMTATSWTPLAETFYNAIGYYGHRSDLRLQSTDFDLTDPNKDPSTYVCRDNYVLILSDGGSTADQNATVNSLAATYPGPSAQTGICSGGFLGSKSLDDLVNLAYTKNIKTFSKTNAATATAPVNKNEKIITYVINTGKAASGSDECLSSGLLLDHAAANGGTGNTSAYLANNASTLNTAMRNVFSAVASRITSGTAASILSNSEGSGANLLQAIFYPQKTFDLLYTKATWIGELQDFWYYIDPFIGKSTVREDTAQDGVMNLKDDYVAQFVFNTHSAQTEVYLMKDSDGNGLGDTVPTHEARFTSDLPATVSADDVRSLWRAGRKLWLMDPATRHIYTQLDGSSLSNFTAVALGTSDTNVQHLFQATSQAEANAIISYIRGTDAMDYRERKLAIPGLNGGVSSEWKLGDIVSSTPRVQSSNKLNTYQLYPPGGYNDVSYDKFAATSEYKNRGMAYVGANDGMLHAFKAGKLGVATSGDQKATLTAGSAGILGNEEWAFIPKNAIPYLTYLTDPGYTNTHLYFVDGTPSVFDASVNTCGAGNYWDCAKDTSGGTNWKTVLIGSMGLGGASKNSGVDAPNSVNTPVTDYGYSSYFALDVTNQTFDPSTGVRNSANIPSFLWEFSHPALGYATSGPAVVRIAATTSGRPDNSKNGRWFAVFASGPTGPIDGSACQFKGKSDQHLKLFVVDLKARAPWVLNTNYWVIDSGIPYAFGGSISGGVIDADRWNQSSQGFYQDDAVYVGYVRNTASDGTGTWTDGGVARLLTHESLNPADWTVAKVIDGVGAVTTNISRLQDRKNHNLWLYFGSGRYFYNQDDMASTRKLYGIKEPCYTASNTISKTCSDTDQVNNLLLTNQSGTTGTISDSLTTGLTNGWYITLDDKDDAHQLGAERSVTDPVAMTNGAVFFTTYEPTGDPCQFGGKSRLWAVKYDTGYQACPPEDLHCARLQGRALVQISTGEFKEIDLSTAFTSRSYRAMGDWMTGKPPGDPPPIVTKANLKPVKKILHIQEH